MKTFTWFFACLVCFTNYCFSQVDPNNDPDWDWLAEPVWILYHQDFNPYVQPPNPFYQGGLSSAVYDNKPEDGWELVLRDFGIPNRQIALPFLILYNKYQGLLRIFVWTKMAPAFSEGAIRLFPDNSAASSATLTFLNNIAWGRNTIDSIMNRTSSATTPVVTNTWAYADFPMAYDPTITSKTNARLQFEVWGITNNTIEIEGLGNINQVMGDNTAGNVSNPGIFQSGGLIDASGKRVSGTQETWLKWQNIIKNIGSKIDSNSTSKSLKNLREWVKNVSNTWTIGNLGLIGAGVGFIDFLITGGRLTNKEQPAPINYALNFKLSGSMITDDQIGAVV